MGFGYTVSRIDYPHIVSNLQVDGYKQTVFLLKKLRLATYKTAIASISIPTSFGSLAT